MDTELSSEALKVPQLIVNDKTVHRILTDFDKVKKSYGNKRIRKSEDLIFHIVCLVRKKEVDHLLQTTIIWVLINLLSKNPLSIRSIMLRAGVPTILHGFLSGHDLATTTRQYASELCLYLCSNDPSPNFKIIFKNTDVNSNNYNHQNLIPLSPISKNTDNNSPNKSDIVNVAPFTPYRINKQNIDRINSIFSDTFEDPLISQSTKSSLPYTGMNTNKNKTHSEAYNPNNNVNNNHIDEDTLDTMSSFELDSFLDNNSTFNRSEFSIPYYENKQKKTKFSSSLPNNNSKYRSSSTTRSDRQSFDMRSNMSPSNVSASPSHASSSFSTHLAGRGSNVAKAKATRHQRRPMTVPELATNPTVAASRARLTVVSGQVKSDFNELHSRLDPLSLNVKKSLKLQTEQEKSVMSQDYSNTVETFPTAGGLTQSRVRVKAEKLVNLDFIQRLFTDNATLADTQLLVRRMQDLFDLIDKDASGFITWESFARVLLATAPPHLLRADIIAFLDAQTDNLQDLVDYREFTISGKVLVVERGPNTSSSNIHITGWLERQRVIVGEASTHSWYNHVKWYRERKATAIIWLMRRAGRALQYYKRVSAAAIYLQYAGVRANSFSDLMDYGRLAMVSYERRLVASHSLKIKCIHARRWRVVKEEAIRFLKQIGREVLLKEHNKARYNNIKPSPNIGQVYKIYYMRKIAVEFLRERVKDAYFKIGLRYDAMLWLTTLGNRVWKQIEVMNAQQQWLAKRGEQAQDHSGRQDAAVLALQRIGQEHALPFMDRQEAHIAWLLERGGRAKVFGALLDDHYTKLSTYAQFILRLSNRRNDAVVYLHKRCENARKLLVKQAVASGYLLRIARAVWTTADNMQRAHLWLVGRAARAMNHSVYLATAHKRLKFVAARAFVVTKKLHTAAADLREIGLQSRLQTFEKHLMAAADNRAKVREEERRFMTLDQRKEEERRGLGVEERWEVELRDVFEAYSLMLAELSGRLVPSNMVYEIGRYSFRKLMQDGKLLGMPPDILDECFDTVDYDGSGLVSFDEVWRWFLHEARKRKATVKRLQTFNAATLFTPRERAIASLMKRRYGHRNNGNGGYSEAGDSIISRTTSGVFFVGRSGSGLVTRKSNHSITFGRLGSTIK